MRITSFLLIVLLGLLLVQVALAASAAKDSKGTTATPKETVKDVPKTTKEAAKEPVKEVPKEAPKATKETPKEAPKEVPKETPKAASKEVPKEAPKETPKEAPKEVPKETPKEAPKEAPKAAPKEATKEAPKETPKEAPKAPPKEAPKETVKETPKEAPKAKDAPRFPKETETKTETKGDAAPEKSFLDTYIPLAQEYGKQAYDLAQVYGKQAAEYGEVAWKEAKKQGAAAAVLAQEYSIVLADAASDYTKVAQEHAHKTSVDIVDKFLDPHHAAIVKKNYLNWYGVGILVADVVVFILLVKHTTWIFKPSTLRVFLVAASLGIYATLATLSILAENPAKGIPASALETIHRGLFYTAIATTVLNVWALVAYPGVRQKNFWVALLSVGLFVEQLELRSHIEDAVGSIPAYSLVALIFLLQAILVFDSIAPATTPAVRVKSVSSPPSASATYIKEEKVKQEKAKKSPKAGK